MRIKYFWLRGSQDPRECWAALKAAQRVFEESWGFVPQDLLDWEDLEGVALPDGIQVHLGEGPSLEDLLPPLEALRKEGLLLALEVAGLFRPLHPGRDLGLIQWAQERGIPVWGLPEGWDGSFPGLDPGQVVPAAKACPRA